MTPTRTKPDAASRGGGAGVAEAGEGDPVVLLHGGGPGATGLSNYSRNIDALAQRYRVIVPDLPGYGRSSKGVDGSDPFGFLADSIRAALDELGVERAHLVGNSYGGACALRLALDTPERVDRMVLMGPGGIGTTRALPTDGLNRLLGYYGGEGPSREKLEKFIREYLVFDGPAVPDELVDLRYEASIDPRRDEGTAHRAVPARRQLVPRAGLPRRAGPGRGDQAGRPPDPQPLVATSTEASARLDDVLGETWTVIARPGALARTARERAEWAAHGAPTFELIDGEPSRDTEIADRDGRLTGFMDEHRVDALVLRPDHFVYAAARAGEPLAPPPALLNPNREIALQEQS